MEKVCTTCWWNDSPMEGPSRKLWASVMGGMRGWEPKREFKYVELGPDVKADRPSKRATPILDEIHEYCRRDVEVTKDLYEARVRGRYTMMRKPEIKKVIFNDPATIVFWNDGTKTVVKAQEGELFDPEKGLAMAISKKVLGNKGNYFNEFKKWLPEERTCAGNCHVCCPIETNDPKKASENCKDCEGFLKRSEVSKDAISKLTKAITATEENWQKAITTYLEGLNKNKCQ